MFLSVLFCYCHISVCTLKDCDLGLFYLMHSHVSIHGWGPSFAGLGNVGTCETEGEGESKHS